jgi:hypothetical protein
MKFFTDTKTVFLRTGVVIFTSICILGTAFSCSLPGNLLGSKPQITLGILKKDPNVKNDGFVRANSLTSFDNQVDNQGLSGVSVNKLVRYDKDTLFAVTTGKGIIKTTDAGVNWKRMFFFPINSTNSDEKAKTKENTAKIAANDALIVNDLAVDPRNSKKIFAALTEGGVGKIYESIDSGDTFKEIYKEVSDKITVNLVAVDPVETEKIYAVLSGGALIKSTDGGQTWQKIRSFGEVPIQLGFVPEFGKIIYLLFATGGLAFSKDNGETWESQQLSKLASNIGETQNKDKFDIPFVENSVFGKYEKVVPVTTGFSFDYDRKIVAQGRTDKPWILVADRQIWVADDISKSFSKLILPAQQEQLGIYDVTYNAKVGLNNLAVSIGNKLFISSNRGNSWDTRDNINLSGTLGNIRQILVDPENPDLVYLALTK